MPGGDVRLRPLVVNVNGVDGLPAVVAANDKDVGARYRVGGIGTMFT